MKKFLALLLTLSTVAQVSAGCNSCAKPASCEPRPRCHTTKVVEVDKPARKVCETNCHYECPAECIRTDRAE
jgi:hypothetical protein